MNPIRHFGNPACTAFHRTASSVRFGIVTYPIEPCRNEDILPMLEMTNEVEAQVSGTFYSRETLLKAKTQIEERLATGKMHLVVVRDNNRIIASGCLDEDKAHSGGAKLSTIYVRPEYQKKGIGETLTRILLDEARKRGYERATLSVHNPVAIRLYNRLGFYPTAIDNHGDIVMERPLLEPTLGAPPKD